MRRKELLKLFETTYKVDPATGKEKRVSHYIGPWYTIGEKQRRACAAKGGVAWLVGVAAFITAGVLPTWAGLCNYVVPWLILCMLPLFYLVLGTVKLARLKERFTQPDKAESIGYMQSSGLGLAVLGALWSITTVIFLLLTQRTLTMRNELIFLGCGLVTAALGLGVWLMVKRLPAAEIKPNEKEAAGEAASAENEENLIS